MFSIVLALTAASVAQQMEPAQQGLAQCQMPNFDSKTCFSLSKVHQAGPSTYTFETEILVDAAGAVTALMHTNVFVRGSEVCETMNGREVANARFASEGHPLSAVEATEYRAKLRASFAAFSGHTICTRIASGAEDTETVVATIDGRRVPAADYEMKWVSLHDGWRVAP